MEHNNERKIVVAIDYGTSKTCVSHALYEPSSADMSEIILVRFDGNDSTPSTVTYDDNGDIVWGKQAKNLASGGYTWTKILLDENQRHEGFQSTLVSDASKAFFVRPESTECQALIIDFLARPHTYILDGLVNNYSSLALPVEYWFTVPAVWKDKTLGLMKEAINAAGYTTRPQDSIWAISEAEAASLSIWKQLPVDVKTDGQFLLVDCGGGTTDLTSFRADDTFRGRSYEQGMATAGLHCGGAEVDWRFATYLEKYMSKPYREGLQDAQDFRQFMLEVKDLKNRFFRQGGAQVSPLASLCGPQSGHNKNNHTTGDRSDR
ncbi:hypothetical protein BJX70DRAFT_403990 [Aspergillus crustosus]